MMKRVILIFLILLNLGTIFFFSHQDSKASGRLSSNLTSQLEVHTPHYAEKNQAQQKVVHTQVQYAVRGLAHGCLFFVLGILFTLFWRTFPHKLLLLFGKNMFLGVLIALSDEIHQIFVPGRTFGWDDIWYDSLGFFLGMCAIMVGNIIHKKRTGNQ